MNGLNVRWSAPGPVAQAYMNSSASVQAICGPVGSAKTTTSLMKFAKLVAQQRPSTRDTLQGRPVRKFRATVVRDTYRNLWRSVLPSWFKRFPQSTGTFTGATNAPAMHRIKFALADGTAADLWVDFVALGDQTAEEALGGYESTCFYLNEAPNLAADVFTYARGRTGRYPDMEEGGPSWHGVMLDMNSPEMGNWCFDGIKTAEATPEAERFDGFFGRLPPGFEFFQQPSGLSPYAENLGGLPPGYYQTLIVGQPAWWVERMVKCKPGYSRSGRPVFPDFDDMRHVAATPLQAMRGRPLIVGIDAGLSPAAAFCQIAPNGQWRVLAELVCEPGVGPKRFAERLSQLLAERFPDHVGGRAIREARPLIQGWADPSSVYGADKEAGEQDWLQKVSHAAGIRISPAPSNSITKRLAAIEEPLRRSIDTEPGFLLSPDCTVLRKGMNAGYKFKQVKAGGTVRDLPEIDKNEFSHVMDGLQYACLGGGFDHDASERRQALHGGRRQIHADTGEGDAEWGR